MAAPARPIPTAALVFLGLFGVAAGAPLSALALMDLGPELALRAHGAHTSATVTDTRVMESRRSTWYEVRYRFAGGGRQWTHSDATGRTNLWSSLPKEDWEASRRSRRVDVLYLKEAPRHNRPARSGAMPLGDKLAGLGLGPFLALAGLGAGLAVARRLWRRLRAS